MSKNPIFKMIPGPDIDIRSIPTEDHEWLVSELTTKAI
jgi:hypothetical protein